MDKMGIVVDFGADRLRAVVQHEDTYRRLDRDVPDPTRHPLLRADRF